MNDKGSICWQVRAYTVTVDDGQWIRACGVFKDERRAQAAAARIQRRLQARARARVMPIYENTSSRAAEDRLG